MLPGVPSTIGGQIDRRVSPHEECYTIACKALEYTRRYLTTEAIARIRPRHHGKDARKVLLLSMDQKLSDNERVSSMLNMLDTGDGTGNLVFLFQSVPELDIH